MKTSFREMLELLNFGEVTISTIQFESCDKFSLLTSSTEIVTSKHSYLTEVWSSKVSKFWWHLQKCNHVN